MLWTLLLACPAPDPEPVDSTPVTETADSGPPPCGSAGQTLPEGLVELALDDGEAEGSLADRALSVYGVSTADSPARHGNRFALEHPTLIHGFSVQWTDLPEDGELTAGLFDDFGYNGFDFWYDAPLWEGTRCVQDTEEGQWLVYAFDEPIEVSQPGLVFVAATREPGGPSLAVDYTGVEADWYSPCGEGFDACTGAMNFPEINDEGNSLEYGISLYTQMKFMARLHVEYTRTDPERFFVDAGVEGLSNRFAWGDYDNDGWDDLYSGSALFHNDQGTLTQVDTGPTSSSSGGVWGDYDNDGCLDLFVFVESYTGGDTLWKGDCQGHFTDVTEAAGGFFDGDQNACDDEANTGAPSPAAAWFDLENDGDLDLIVSNFICWSSGATYADHVWRNDDGVFTRVTDVGFLNLPYAGRGASPADADNDGDIDVMVNNYRLHKNLYYENKGDGSVRERGAATRLAGDGSGLAYGHTIGVAWGDLDNDGWLDQVQGNLAHPRWFSFSDKSMVLMNPAGEGNAYQDLSGDWEDGPYGLAGLRFQETHSVPTLGDFDHDGNLDLVISAVYEGRPTDFYWGVGDGTFVLDVYDAGITVTNGWGQGVADVDHDGDLDLAVKGAMLENTREDQRSWVQVRAVGNVASNRGAYGATVRVTDDTGQTRIRHVQGGTGQGCQDSPTLHFGLGDATTIEHIEVDFPGGGTVAFEGPWDADQRLWVYEDGTVTAGWSP